MASVSRKTFPQALSLNYLFRAIFESQWEQDITLVLTSIVSSI
jgi:hypothetical protein